MPTESFTKRLPGGRFPANKAAACFFFGPLLVNEFDRLNVSSIEALAAAGALGEGDAQPARASIYMLQELLRFELPSKYTVTIPKASMRTHDGRFRMEIRRQLLSGFLKDIKSGSGEGWLKHRSDILAENYPSLWRGLFGRNFGSSFQALPVFRSLSANLATAIAGVELFLYDIMSGEGRGFMADAKPMLDEIDMGRLQTYALKYDVSTGVVMAAAVVLYGRKNSAAIRSSLLNGNWDPLHDALWAPLIPSYKSHPYFSIYLDRMQTPSSPVKATPAKPQRSTATGIKGISAPKSSPVTSVETKDATADLASSSTTPLAPTAKPPAPTTTLPGSAMDAYRKHQTI